MAWPQRNREFEGRERFRPDQSQHAPDSVDGYFGGHSAPRPTVTVHLAAQMVGTASNRKMLKETLATLSLDSCHEELRFDRWRSLENPYGTGSNGRMRGDFSRWYYRCLAVLLKAGLKITGQYTRGVTNALSPVIRYVTLEFAGLPRGLEGYPPLKWARYRQRDHKRAV